jgi:hypothetical protein
MATSSALAGLHIAAGGQHAGLAARPRRPFAFHVDVPAGAAALDIRFEHLGRSTVAAAGSR